MRIVISTTLSLVLLVASVAEAQSASPPLVASDLDERARVHFQAGTDYFERGDYEAALRELELAYQMSPRPALLYNLGACLERMGRLEDAASRLEAYVAEAQPADGAAITERAQRLRARAAEAASSRADASAEEARARQGEAESEAAEGEAAEGRAIPVVVDPEQGRAPHVASWITLGVGAAALVSFGVLGGLALAEDDALASRCGTSCARADVGTLESLAIGADVSLAVGLVLAATGVVLALTTDEGGSDAPRVELGPGALRVRF